MSTLPFVIHTKQQEVAESGRIRRITGGMASCAVLCGEVYDTKSEKRQTEDRMTHNLSLDNCKLLGFNVFNPVAPTEKHP